MPKLSRITLFPIKSLDGMEVSRAELLASGPLQNDRRFAIFDRDGQLINGKWTAAIHGIRARFDSDVRRVEFSISTGDPPTTGLNLHEDRSAIEAWLSQALAAECRLEENTETAFPDDTIASGPTVVSTNTLRQLGEWFDLPVDEVRRRFRANLEIDADQPFWEDRLFGPSPQRPVRFKIGPVRFYGMNPCARCIVPTRESGTGRAAAGFAKRLAHLREATLPEWADRDAFDHYYRLAVNTSLAPGQNGPLRIQVGDELKLL